MLSTLLLDVNGTLTDPSAIGRSWDSPELGERVLATAISTAMVDALLGTAGRPFSDHLRAAIEVLVEDLGLDPHGIAVAVETAAALPARPGAADALRRLAGAGVRLIALTNSGEEAGERTLEACGLAQYVDRVLGVDAVATFKPHPSVYRYALAQLAVEPSEAALVATHPWDLAGAAHVGFRSAWVRHGARAWPAVFPAPTVEAETLPELASALLEDQG
jgi:2-haloacid dehalogenase